MIIFPPCKINLGLSVVEKRSDGFHNVQTVLYPIPLRDALEIIPVKGKARFSASGITLEGNPDDNLVVKAYRLMNTRFGVGPVWIHLHKAVPAGAGLGGGSSDAAHTLRLLSELFNLGLTTGEMEDLARELGSDVAFFIQNKPRLAHGKGDQLKQLTLALEDYEILLVKAPVHISTAQAYSWIIPHQGDRPLEEVIQKPVENWQGELYNDFEGPVFERYPELAEIKRKILGMGAVYASMTGSGSAIFGIFCKGKLPVAHIDFPECFVWDSR